MALNSLLRQLKFHHLQLIVALDDFRHMGRAADYLNLTQPAISRTLRELESQLSASLFERSARGTTPTKAGDLLIEFARQTLNNLSRTSEYLDTLNGPQQWVRIGTATLSGWEKIAGGVARLKIAYPHINIEVVQDTTEALFTKLHLHDIDLLIARIDNLANSAIFRVTPLFAELTAIACRRDHPFRTKGINWETALSLPWILPPRGTALRQRFEGFLSSNDLHHPHNIIEVRSFLSVVTLLQHMDALALLPDSMCDWFTTLALAAKLPLGLSEGPATIGIVELASRDTDPVAQLFVNELLKLEEYS